MSLKNMTIREIILERWILTPGRHINLLFLAATFAIGCERGRARER